MDGKVRHTELRDLTEDETPDKFRGLKQGADDGEFGEGSGTVSKMFDVEGAVAQPLWLLSVAV
jgi:hypothetical protein